jgi:hypothetical protein
MRVQLKMESECRFDCFCSQPVSRQYIPVSLRLQLIDLTRMRQINFCRRWSTFG